MLALLRDDYPLEQENGKNIKKHRLRRAEALESEAWDHVVGAKDGQGLHAALSLSVCSALTTLYVC